MCGHHIIRIKTLLYSTFQILHVHTFRYVNYTTLLRILCTLPLYLFTCSLIPCVWCVQGGTLRKGKSVGDSASQEKLTDSVDLESCPVVMHTGRKRKTTQNTQSHGSFFLRVGAIGMRLWLNTKLNFHYSSPKIGTVYISYDYQKHLHSCNFSQPILGNKFRKSYCSFCISNGCTGLRSFATLHP